MYIPVTYEGDWDSRLKQIFTRPIDALKLGVRYELATVVEAPPNLKVRRDDDQLLLDADDLVVLEHLTRHERIMTLEHVELTERDLGDKTGINHLDTDDLAPPATTYLHSYIKAKFEDVLKVGDRVVLASDDQAMVFYVVDRAVFYPKDHVE